MSCVMGDAGVIARLLNHSPIFRRRWRGQMESIQSIYRELDSKLRNMEGIVRFDPSEVMTA